MKPENEDTFSGLRIPSVEDIAEEIVGLLGSATVDLGHPLHRQRLKNALGRCIGMVLEYEMERAIIASNERAVKHVFRLMRDPNYQDKRAKYRKQRAKDLKERREKKALADKQARMDYSKQNLVVSKATIQ